MADKLLGGIVARIGLILLIVVGACVAGYIVDQPDAARGKDAFIWPRNVNYNMGTDLYVVLNASSFRETAQLIQFDTLNVIPSGSTIDSARITYKRFAASGSGIIYTSRMIQYWDEGNKDRTSASDGEMTWNCYSQPNTWQIAGAKGANDRSADLDSQAVAMDSPLIIDVTNTVQAIVDAGYNNGILHYMLPVGSYYWWGYTSDSPVASNRPKLEVWWTEPPPSDSKKQIYLWYDNDEEIIWTR